MENHGADELYLDLIRRVLTRFGFETPYRQIEERRDTRGRVLQAIDQWLRRRNWALVRLKEFDPENRRLGKDWPPEAETMVGIERLKNLDACIARIVSEGVEGDLLEAGVWRGGASIFMMAALKARGCGSRRLWLADSFQGLPKPSGAFVQDLTGPQFWNRRELAVSCEQVIRNFEKYALWDPARIRFLEGWFQDTLPTAPIERLSLLRLDGDMYESTMVALKALYPRLSPGGYCIVDDYGFVPACKQAVHDYREEFRVREPMLPVDDTCVFWRKQPDRSA